MAGAGGGDWVHYPGSEAGSLSPCVISGLGGAGAGGAPTDVNNQFFPLLPVIITGEPPTIILEVTP